MAKDKKNSRAARRGESEQIDLELPRANESSGKTRVLEELAIKQTRISDDSLKPKSVARTKSKAKSRRDKEKKKRAEAFSDMLEEKVKASTQRHKTVREYRKDDEEDK